MLHLTNLYLKVKTSISNFKLLSMFLTHCEI
jgi:hypothetical protein